MTEVKSTMTPEDCGRNAEGPRGERGVEGQDYHAVFTNHTSNFIYPYDHINIFKHVKYILLY